jgi:hypothetical protein
MAHIGLPSHHIQLTILLVIKRNGGTKKPT